MSELAAVTDWHNPIVSGEVNHMKVEYVERRGTKGPALRIYDYSQNDEKRFVDLIKSKGGFIRWIMGKFSFINDDNRDDYYQEIVCQAWKSFHSYQPGTNFGTWLYRPAEWAILGFYKSTRKHDDRTYHVEDFLDFDVPDDVDTFFEDFEPLYRAIADLPASLRRPVEIYLQGEGRALGKAATDAGKASTYYATALYKARQYILKNRHKYFDKVKVDPAKLQKRTMPAGMVKDTKPVEMRGMDGRFIKSYPSTQAVALDGFSQSNVFSCCTGKRHSHKGYRWNYVGEHREEILNRAKGKGFLKVAKKVQQLDLKGNVVRVWQSAREAREQGGFNEHSIRFVINGKYKEHRGFIWRWAE